MTKQEVNDLLAQGYDCGQIALRSAAEQFASFRARFAEKNGSCMCRELLGYNLSVPEEAQKIAELGLTQSKCPEIIWNAVELLKEYL